VGEVTLSRRRSTRSPARTSSASRPPVGIATHTRIRATFSMVAASCSPVGTLELLYRGASVGGGLRGGSSARDNGEFPEQAAASRPRWGSGRAGQESGRWAIPHATRRIVSTGRSSADWRASAAAALRIDVRSAGAGTCGWLVGTDPLGSDGDGVAASERIALLQVPHGRRDNQAGRAVDRAKETPFPGIPRAPRSAHICSSFSTCQRFLPLGPDSLGHARRLLIRLDPCSGLPHMKVSVYGCPSENNSVTWEYMDEMMKNDLRAKDRPVPKDWVLKNNTFPLVFSSKYSIHYSHFIR